MGKLAVYTVGCKVNQSESEELKAALCQAGHTLCGDPAAADLCVVNTCTVTAESDRKCRKLIRWLNRQGAGKIVVAGCYANLRPEELAPLPGVVRVLSREEKDRWHREVDMMLPHPEAARSAFPMARCRAFVKVQDGCERSCSYCIVPEARGEEKSRPIDEVLDLAASWLKKGVREIVLCGVNLGKYGGGFGVDLGDLMRSVIGLGEGFRVRLSSIELEDLEMSWVEEWSRSGKVCPHLHLPLQSGDDAILRDMGRGYGQNDFLAAVNKLRVAWPDAALTTEVIVGYPGESEAAFAETLKVLQEVRPSRVHVFRFSPRPGTAAGNRDDFLSPEVIRRRSSILLERARRWRLQYAEERLGCACGFLVEHVTERNGVRVATGTTEDYIKAYLVEPQPEVRAGCLLKAYISGVSGDNVFVTPYKEYGGDGGSRKGFAG